MKRGSNDRVSTDSYNRGRAEGNKKMGEDSKDRVKTQTVGTQ